MRRSATFCPNYTLYTCHQRLDLNLPCRRSEGVKFAYNRMLLDTPTKPAPAHCPLENSQFTRKWREPTMSTVVKFLSYIYIRHSFGHKKNPTAPTVIIFLHKSRYIHICHFFGRRVKHTMPTIIIFLHKSLYIHIRYSFGQKKNPTTPTVIIFFASLEERDCVRSL
jgi:hypothetical protein